MIKAARAQFINKNENVFRKSIANNCAIKHAF